MLVYNPFVNDSRVRKEARTLVGAGHNVLVLAMWAPGLRRIEVQDGVRTERIDADPLPVRVLRSLAKRRGRSRRAGSCDHPSQATAGDRGAARRDVGRPSLPVRLAHYVYQSLAYFRFTRATLGILRRRPVDLIVAHDLEMLPVAELARATMGSRASVLYDSHELFVERRFTVPPRSLLWKPRWRAVERVLIRRADHVMTVCDPIANELASRYGITRPSVLLNTPYVGASSLGDDDGDTKGAIMALREKLGIRAPRVLLLYLGGLQDYRGLEQAVDALVHLPGAELAVMGVGTAEFISSLKDRSERRGVAERLHILPPVPADDVVRHARAADVGLCTIRNAGLSYYHSLPNKLFEYMAGGIPVVASDFPSMGGLVKRTGIGLTCDPEDPAAIARSICQITRDPQRYSRLKHNALTASQRFTWDRESRKLVEIVDGLGGQSMHSTRYTPNR